VNQTSNRHQGLSGLSLRAEERRPRFTSQTQQSSLRKFKLLKLKDVVYNMKYNAPSVSVLVAYCKTKGKLFIWRPESK
jgi:hypothetical protein